MLMWMCQKIVYLSHPFMVIETHKTPSFIFFGGASFPVEKLMPRGFLLQTTFSSDCKVIIFFFLYLAYYTKVWE